ncbi:MAG: hypothetical protein IT289_01025 [Oligoflexia bacterium]|nr:hypothetical protein [Oligoflexia bacterium]
MKKFSLILVFSILSITAQAQVQPAVSEDPSSVIAMEVNPSFLSEFANGAIGAGIEAVKEGVNFFALDLPVLGAFSVELGVIKVAQKSGKLSSEEASGMMTEIQKHQSEFEAESALVQSMIDQGILKTVAQIPGHLFQATVMNMGRCFEKNGRACGAGVANSLLIFLPAKVVRGKVKAFNSARKAAKAAEAARRTGRPLNLIEVP